MSDDDSPFVKEWATTHHNGLSTSVSAIAMMNKPVEKTAVFFIAHERAIYLFIDELVGTFDFEERVGLANLLVKKFTELSHIGHSILVVQLPIESDYYFSDGILFATIDVSLWHKRRDEMGRHFTEYRTWFNFEYDRKV